MSRYDDIIHLPHPVSKVHPPMSMHDRAAQFAPFAALTGYGAVLQETARLTEERIELDECAKAELDGWFQWLQRHLTDRPLLRFTVFIPDRRKSGGAYESLCGEVKKLDEFGRKIILADGREIFLDDILSIEKD